MFCGLNPKNKPNAATFDNKYNYSEMLVEKDITLYSTCEHHFLPIVGKAHIAYISSGNVIGLSKMNRIVEYYAKRPQVQERLTKQILEDHQEVMLEPMNSVDRKTLHDAVADIDGIQSYSEGREPYRSVVFAPSEVQESKKEEE